MSSFLGNEIKGVINDEQLTQNKQYKNDVILFLAKKGEHLKLSKMFL